MYSFTFQLLLSQTTNIANNIFWNRKGGFEIMFCFVLFLRGGGWGGGLNFDLS